MLLFEYLIARNVDLASLLLLALAESVIEAAEGASEVGDQTAGVFRFHGIAITLMDRLVELFFIVAEPGAGFRDILPDRPVGRREGIGPFGRVVEAGNRGPQILRGLQLGLLAADGVDGVVVRPE